jgi:cytochrome P450
MVLPFLEHIPYFRRPQLAYNLDQYHETIQELIELKKEELKNEVVRSNKDLISALVQSNEDSEEGKLTMEQIRVINLF